MPEDDRLRSKPDGIMWLECLYIYIYICIMSLYWYIVVYWRNIIYCTDSPYVQVIEVNFAKAEMRCRVHRPEIQAKDSYTTELFSSIESENILWNILVKVLLSFYATECRSVQLDCSTAIATEFWVKSHKLSMKVTLEVLKNI